jgi:hypothetical protein
MCYGSKRKESAQVCVDTAMAALSNAALKVLTTLAEDDQAVVLTVRHARDSKAAAWVSTRGDAYDKTRRSHVPIATFHRIHRTGLLAKVRDWQAFGVTYAEYELTDAGRAALEAA